MIEDLVQAAQGGDRQAFTALVTRTRGLVAAVAAGDDDLIQDVFLQAWKRLESLREPRAFKGWLVRLTLNEVRMTARRRTVERAAMPRLAREAAARTPQPRDTLEQSESHARLVSELASLEPETRAILTLRYIEGRKAPEIAESLGLKPDAVRQRLSRALRTLRERLQS